jgi:hypothetical protein
MKRCPHCDAIALPFCKDHCPNPDCDWYVCIHCRTTYSRTQDVGYLNRGKTTWHSNTKADT